jgi:hypothetical protein
MIWIVNAEITGDYQVKVKFNDGLSGIIDFKKILKKDSRLVVRELLDINNSFSCRAGCSNVDKKPHFHLIQNNRPTSVAIM